MLGLFSVSIAIREWVRRRMKNRVDAYLVRVEEIAADIENQSGEALLRKYAELQSLRREAFADLVAERLQADEAFIILQNHLREELAAVGTKLEAGRTGA